MNSRLLTNGFVKGRLHLKRLEKCRHLGDVAQFDNSVEIMALKDHFHPLKADNNGKFTGELNHRGNVYLYVTSCQASKNKIF